MKKFLSALWICIVLILGLSCANEQSVKQDWIVANFEIRYLKPERHLRAQADFSKGDSLNLKPHTFPTVQYNGKSMTLKKLTAKMPRYQSEQYTDYQKRHAFRFIDANNTEHHFDLSMSPIDSFQITEPIDPTQDLSISWTGDPLQKNESLVLLFTDKENKASSQTVQGPTSKSAIMLKAQQLAKLSPGEGQLYLVKKQIKFAEKKGVKIRTLVEYYTNAITIEVKKGNK
jgi:hypothetical protein